MRRDGLLPRGLPSISSLIRWGIVLQPHRAAWATCHATFSSMLGFLGILCFLCHVAFMVAAPSIPYIPASKYRIDLPCFVDSRMFTLLRRTGIGPGSKFPGGGNSKDQPAIAQSKIGRVSEGMTLRFTPRLALGVIMGPTSFQLSFTRSAWLLELAQLRCI